MPANLENSAVATGLKKKKKKSCLISFGHLSQISDFPSEEEAWRLIRWP